MCKVYSVVVTYNGQKWIERCLNSLQESNMKTTILVIDNKSTDETVSIIERNFPDVLLIKSEKNLGFGQANNIGMRKALEENADYVFLLNQDAWLLRNDSLRKLVDCYNNPSNKQFAVICPFHMFGGTERLILGKNYMELISKKGNDILSDLLLRRPLNELYEIKYACAACWLLPVSTITTIGGFDPLFFHYGEDDNYMQRIHYHGFKFGVCTNSFICHDIEFRPANYQVQYNTKKKNLLIEISDINNDGNYRRLKINILNKFFQNALFLKLKSAHHYLKIYLFLLKMKKPISISKSVNVNLGENWLK